jgi:hypothetical protein
MSMHKIPLTPTEEAGLHAHGLQSNIGKPSQLTDAFRQGVAWGIAHAAAEKETEPKQDFCFCNDDISLQMVSGGAAPEGLYGTVTLKIGDQDVRYVKDEHVSAASDDCYYLQHTHSYVGNCPLWWIKDGQGYTTDLRKAQKYTLSQAIKLHNFRNSDVPWHCSEIDALWRKTVDMQDMGRELHSRQDQIATLLAKVALMTITGKSVAFDTDKLEK